jgi:hypothetical protein
MHAGVTVTVGTRMVAGSPDRRAAEAAIHSPFQPEGEKLRKGETERETGVSVGPSRGPGAKRLRRSRWESGTYERVARGGVRPTAGAGGYPTRIDDDPGGRAKGCGVLSAVGYITRNADEHELPVGSSRECEGCGQRTWRI